MRKILVTGSEGQLGLELQRLSVGNSDYHFFFSNHYTLDIARDRDVRDVIIRDKPDIVINCAAYTKVDKAEEARKDALAINSEALKYLARACNDVYAVLIHLSTDYVYDSINNRPLIETDPLEPKSVYAKSKKIGEDNLIAIANRWIIIRTSWIYSQFGQNFVKTMLKLGRRNDVLKVVDDQIGTPTYAKDLAEVIIHMIDLIRSQNEGSPLVNNVYNFSNSGHTTWDAFARKIFDLSGIKCKVKGVNTTSFGANAARPLWSVLSKEKIQSTMDIKIRHWESALKECLETLVINNK